MTLKRFSIPLVLVAFLALWLASCELSASTPPPSASPTNEGAMSTLQAELGIIATQTALAKAATPGGIELPTIEATPQPTSLLPAGPTEVTEPTSQPTSAPAETTAAPKPTKETKKFEPPPIPDTYALNSGEFPFCIARRFNVDQYELLNINGLSLNSRPDVGYVLEIPQTGDHFSGDRELRSHPDTYTVRSGDTIYSIACMYGDVYPQAIAQANNLKSPYDLTPGETIDIP